MEIKKIDTLFHGTKKIEHMLSILENGFFPSYANEKFAGRNTKILMVSFSNIPLIEARNQVNYGDYFIGLKRSWGIENKLHPVAYTYENSAYENDVYDLIQGSALGQSLLLLKEFSNKGITLNISGDRLNIGDLSKQNIDSATLTSLKSFFENVYLKINNMQLYLKHYVALDKNNVEKFSYNDREWRYVPQNIPQPLIFQTNAAGDVFNPQYIEYEKMEKPHSKTNPLTFEINDINYIIVKEKKDMQTIFNALYQKFSEGKSL